MHNVLICTGDQPRLDPADLNPLFSRHPRRPQHVGCWQPGSPESSVEKQQGPGKPLRRSDQQMAGFSSRLPWTSGRPNPGEAGCSSPRRASFCQLPPQQSPEVMGGAQPCCSAGAGRRQSPLAGAPLRLRGAGLPLLCWGPLGSSPWRQGAPEDPFGNSATPCEGYS